MAERERWLERLIRFSRGAQPRDAARKRQRGILLIAGVVLLVLLPVSQSAPWKLAGGRVYDLLSTTAAPDRTADGPVIVAIDEPSLAEIGLQWPWPRELHAQLIEALRAAGAKAIGVDIIFAEPTSTEADGALAAVALPDTVLATDETLIETPQAEQLIRVEPLADLLANGARAGVASISLDGDGVLRRIPLYPDGFAASLLEVAGMEANRPPRGALLQSFGAPRSYPTVSYYQALQPDEFLPPDFFRDRIVIVGLSLQNAPTTDAGGADAYATPSTTRTGRLTSGAEIQATILDNLSEGLFVRQPTDIATLVITLFAALLAAHAVWRRSGWRTVAAGAGALFGFVAGSYLLLRFGRVFLGPLTPSLAFIFIAAAQGARDYAAERRLRQSITRAFSQYLSPVLVERLADDPSQLKLGGERRTLTLLFCDVRGFTAISERLKDDPQRLTQLVNRLLSPLSEVVMAEGGTIDKYIGDCLMAFWNAPLDDPDHAAHAVSAGLKMLVALDGLNAQLVAEAEAEGIQPVTVRVGIGINTGDCVVGNMGSDQRFDYSALGDPVNLASRLEAKTRDYEVPMLLGPETVRRVQSVYPIVELDRIAVKGRAEILPVSTVLYGATPEALDRHRTLLADLYGGTLSQDDPRFAELAAAMPSLAGYYRAVAQRLSAPPSAPIISLAG
jgi:adenylate cyclase